MKIFQLLLALSFWPLGPALAAAPTNSCVTCHAELDGPLSEAAKKFDTDIHHQEGLGCADCHGGDPKDESMDAMSAAKGFRGTPKKAEIPQFCGGCHSDATYMRRFKPGLRTDQLSQYRTSIHGIRIKQGDQKVAACVDCHGVHNILAVTDTRAPVYPTNVATTCARCHADATYMKTYNIPTNQVALYERSVHAQVLAKGDTSAPTCSTCHGNHGAAPPGVASVENVCGTCHVVNQQLFEKSPHQSAFAAMGLPGCVQCHSNHEIVKATDNMVGVGPQSVCTACHASDDKGYAAAKEMARDLAMLNASFGRAEQILTAAERSGMEVSGPKVELTNAHEALIKARVNLHAFDAADVRKFTDQGDEISQKAYQAGVAALHERDVRRKGLGVSLIFIVIVITGLYLRIRQIESPPS